MFFLITTQHSSIKVKKNSHFVPILRKGAPNPLADLNGGGGCIYTSGFGLGGPNLGGPNPPGHRDDVSSHLKYYRLSSEILDYKLILFRSGHFDHDMEKIWQLLVYSKHPNTLRNIGNAVKVLVNSHSTREYMRQWKKARLIEDVFEVFGIKVVVGSDGRYICNFSRVKAII